MAFSALVMYFLYTYVV